MDKSLINRILPWLAIAVAVLLAVYIGRESLARMAAQWSREEYSHAFLLPGVIVFLLLNRPQRLEFRNEDYNVLGLVLVVAGVLGVYAGELSTLYVIVQYSFILIVWGVLLASLGARQFLQILPILAIMLFMIPLPGFLYNNLSQKLQLLSSEIGVSIVRLFGISVFLEGNVIDLGKMQLQVVEACSGLRYLFPFAALSYIAAYLYKGAAWKRFVIFLSSVPIAILMNSLRIGIIGMLVEYWGPSMAQGFLHAFEGWVVFMLCTAVLLLEMFLLSHVGKDRRPFSQAFSLSISWPKRTNDGLRQAVPRPLLASVAVLTITAVVATAAPERAEALPDRELLDRFPLKLGEWTGHPDRLEDIYLDELDLDDYFLGDYRGRNGRVINFYVAYYDSQRKGESAHSPRTCLPGGGWEIETLAQEQIQAVEVHGSPLRVNRAVIRYQDETQLVYYWFQQRGRIITNEYLVKGYLFWDALTRNRTDGALVRLTTRVGDGEGIVSADDRLREFAKAAVPELAAYVPE